MQQIFYREFPPIQASYEEGVKHSSTIPSPEDVGSLCGAMQTWAQQNGWRVTSIAPVMGVRDNMVGIRAPAHTMGLVFVCDQL